MKKAMKLTYGLRVYRSVVQGLVKKKEDVLYMTCVRHI